MTDRSVRGADLLRALRGRLSHDGVRSALAAVAAGRPGEGGLPDPHDRATVLCATHLLRGRDRSFDDGQPGPTSPADAAVTIGWLRFERLLNGSETLRRSIGIRKMDRQRALGARVAEAARLDRFGSRVFARTRLRTLAAEAEAAAHDLSLLQNESAGAVLEIDFSFDASGRRAFAALARSFELVKGAERIWEVSGPIRAEDDVAADSPARVGYTRVWLTRANPDAVVSAEEGLRFETDERCEIFLYPTFALMRVDGGEFEVLDLNLVHLEFETWLVPQSGPMFAEVRGINPDDHAANGRHLARHGALILRVGRRTCRLLVSDASSAAAFHHAWHAYFAEHTVVTRVSAPARALEFAGAPPNVRRSAYVPHSLWRETALVAILTLLVAVSAWELYGRPPAPRLAAPLEDASSAQVPAEPPPDPTVDALSSSVDRADFAGPQREGPTDAGTSSLEKPSATAIDPSAGAARTAEPPSRREHVFVLSAAVNLRAAPSISAAILAVEPRGREFSVFGREGSWVQVGDGTPVGWIYGELLSPASR